jgi:predicted amidohydrolase
MTEVPSLVRPATPSSELTVAVLQFNPVVGDLAGNARAIVDASRQAYAQGARLVLTPEMALCGYPPEDLLLRPAFMQACAEAVVSIASQLADLPDLHLVLGHPQALPGDDARTRSWSIPRCLNAASLLVGGVVSATYAKRELPNYQVFDERRYFVSGREAGLGPVVVDVLGWRVGLLVCEDAWFDEPGRSALDLGAQALLVLNASPYHAGKRAEREQRMADRAKAWGLPLVYAHLVGGQDEVVFDGASFAVNAQGDVGARAPSFASATALVHLQPGGGVRGEIAPPLSDEAEIWAALVTGVRDYLGKNGFPGAIIGLSGGIDSALVLAIAVDALGADKVRTVMMPSPYTADISWIDAKDMADRLEGVAGSSVRRPPRRHHRREHPGPHPRHLAHGPVQQDGRHRADHWQQERDGHRLLHAVWRHGRRICRHQGPGQNPGLPPVALAQCRGCGPRRGGAHPRTHHHPATLGRAAPRSDRPGQPARVRGARRHPGALHGARPVHRRHRGRGFCARRRGQGHAPDQAQ